MIFEGSCDFEVNYILKYYNTVKNNHFNRNRNGVFQNKTKSYRNHNFLSADYNSFKLFIGFKSFLKFLLGLKLHFSNCKEGWI